MNVKRLAALLARQRRPVLAWIVSRDDWPQVARGLAAAGTEYVALRADDVIHVTVIPHAAPPAGILSTEITTVAGVLVREWHARYGDAGVYVTSGWATAAGGRTP